MVKEMMHMVDFYYYHNLFHDRVFFIFLIDPSNLGSAAEVAEGFS
jgi:hypothetical protein